MLDEKSKKLRRMIVQAVVSGGRGHIGPAGSLVELLRVIYDKWLRFDVDNPKWTGRDRFILSKGHGCLALYTVLADKGFISHGELETFCRSDSILGGHPEIKIPGVEASTGSLGHGLSIGVGMALAAKISDSSYRVGVVVGDGEINEGAVWEAAMSANKHKLSNLVVFIDYNKMQSYGSTSDVLDLEPLKSKWESFGFETVEIDGHDISALESLMEVLPLHKSRPSTVICHTVKGKGFGIASGNPDWHHKSRLSSAEVQDLTRDLN